MMSCIRGKHTRPEMTIRRRLHAIGLRFRLHPPNVVGRPDLVFSRLRAAIFIDGCFWHGCPRHYAAPVARRDFWKAKLEANVRRREDVRVHLTDAGWAILEIWECEIRKDEDRVVSCLLAWLGSLGTDVAR
jgi:DNA mismatch endonuclease, patch repair protein